jgi:hypothetical protein
MGFRFQDLMVDVLAAEAGQDPGCPHDTTHDDRCAFDTTKDREEECPGNSGEPCPFDTTISQEPPPEKRQQADLTLLKQQLHLALAELR